MVILHKSMKDLLENQNSRLLFSLISIGSSTGAQFNNYACDWVSCKKISPMILDLCPRQDYLASHDQKLLVWVFFVHLKIFAVVFFFLDMKWVGSNFVEFVLMGSTFLKFSIILCNILFFHNLFYSVSFWCLQPQS